MSEPHRAADAPRDGADQDERERLDAELDRLARMGAERRSSLETTAHLDRQTEGYRRLRIAIGAYRGSAVKRTVLALVGLAGLVGSVVVLVSAPVMALAVISIVVSLLLGLYFVMPPLASEGAIAAEAQWVASLPFGLHGYFEVLSAAPQVTRVIVYDISWTGAAPDATLLENVVAAIDPKARVEPSAAGNARILSGPISGLTSVKRSSTSYVTSNHEIPGSVHTFVENVLSSLHRRYPLARVSLTSR